MTYNDFEMGRIRFHLQGKAPGLLMHSPAAMAVGGAETMKRKKIPTPDEEAKMACYAVESGQLYTLTVGYRNAAIDAVAGQRIGKQYASRLLGQTVFPALDEGSERKCLLTWEGKPIDSYVVDVRRVKVQDAGVMRARPLISRWQTIVEFEYLEEEMPPHIIFEAMVRAGKLVGVGDYRPRCPKGKGGPFGRFVVNRCEVFSGGEWKEFSPDAPKPAVERKGKKAA